MFNGKNNLNLTYLLKKVTIGKVVINIKLTIGVYMKYLFLLILSFICVNVYGGIEQSRMSRPAEITTGPPICRREINFPSQRMIAVPHQDSTVIWLRQRPPFGGANYDQVEQQNTLSMEKSSFVLKPIVFSLRAQALAYIAQSSSTNEELKEVMPEEIFERVVLLRKAIKRLAKYSNLGDPIANLLLGKLLSQDILLVETLLICVKHIKQEVLIKDILGNAALVSALETFKFFYSNGLALDSNQLGSYLADIACANEQTKSNQIKMAQFLLDNGADINATGVFGLTSLFSAARKGHVELVEYLLQHGAAVNGNKIGNSTPLAGLLFHSTLMELHEKAIAIVKLLLQYNADTKGLYQYEGEVMTALHRLEKMLEESPKISGIILPIIDLIKEHQANTQMQPSARNQVT